MAGNRFDDLTRLLGRVGTRRHALTAALGLTALAADSAAANGRRDTCRPYGAGCTRSAQCCTENCVTGRRVPRHLRNRCACAVDATRCGPMCVDTMLDSFNCGDCGVACDQVNGEFCVSGTCTSTCAAVLEACEGDGDCCDPGSKGCFASVCKIKIGQPCSPDGVNLSCSGNYCDSGTCST